MRNTCRKLSGKSGGLLGRCLAFGLVLSFGATQAIAALNAPCSGKKGGVSHCQESQFVCQDGSVSQSKKICSPGEYGKTKTTEKTTKPTKPIKPASP